MSTMKSPNKSIIRDPKTGRVRVQTVNMEDSKTQQQFKDQCDVNKIVAKYKRDTGRWLHLMSPNGGRYADVSSIKDYHSMLLQLQDANSAFMALPALVRQRFQNDPGKLLQFMQDPKNYDEGVKLGIFEPKKQNVPDANKNDLNEITNPPATKTKTKALDPKLKPDEE